MIVLNLYILMIRICFGFRYSIFVLVLKIIELTTLKDLYERIRTKFSANYAKQTHLWDTQIGLSAVSTKEYRKYPAFRKTRAN